MKIHVTTKSEIIVGMVALKIYAATKFEIVVGMVALKAEKPAAKLLRYVKKVAVKVKWLPF